MDDLDALRATVPSDEEILAVGAAVQMAVVVTSRRIIRKGHGGPVSIPFDAVVRWEEWRTAHRWSIVLVHEPIDPRVAPSDAHQWWRWLDRRADRRRTARRRRETRLDFSREHTRAAGAIRARLEEIGLECASAHVRAPGGRRAAVLMYRGSWRGRPRRLGGRRRSPRGIR